MSQEEARDKSQQDCPKCDGDLEAHPNPETGLLWCDSCEREYWTEREDGPWWSCGMDGEIERVTEE